MKPQIGDVYHFHTGIESYYWFYLRVIAVWGDFVSYMKEDGRKQDMHFGLFCKYIKRRQMVKITDISQLAKVLLGGLS